MQPHIFISYSRQDTVVMRRIRDDLEQACLRVWTDEGIEIGTHSWKEAIEQALRESQIIVILMSPDANQSKWVQREIDYAELHGVQMLPLLIRGTPRESVPFALIGSQYIDLRRRYNQGMQRLIQRIYADLNQNEETIPSRPTVVRRFNRFMLSAVAVIGLLALIWFSGLIDVLEFNTSLPVNAVTPQRVVLTYDEQSLVITNEDENAIRLDNLSFTLFEQPQQAQYIVFSREFGLQRALNQQQCLHIWDSSYRSIRLQDAAPNECQQRTRYWTTYRTFWMSEVSGAQFEVRHDGVVITFCPAMTPNQRQPVSCELLLTDHS